MLPTHPEDETVAPQIHANLVVQASRLHGVVGWQRAAETAAPQFRRRFLVAVGVRPTGREGGKSEIRNPKLL